jgi:AcrR family transcriptional regulator
LSDAAAAHAPDLAEEPTLGRREAAKAERRRRIIEAARALIRETGNPGLSMRALAARAGVSLATPYNLFGSKRAIVLALLEDVREFGDRFAAVRSVDPLERMFAAVDISTDFYIADPQFYKTLWSAVFDTSDEVRTAIYNPKANAFWLQLVQAAEAQGVLVGGVDSRLILIQLLHVFRSAMLDWVVGEVSAQALAPTIRLGYAMILNGVAAPDWRGPLQARILDSQARLLQSGG